MSKSNIRSVDCEFVINENEFIIEGRAIVFNQMAYIGDYYEVILPSALDKCNLKDVCLLINHQQNEIPLARYREGDESSTLQLFIREDGLYFRAVLDINAPAAQNLISAIKRNVLNKMSFRFFIFNDESCIRVEKTEAGIVRYVHNILLVNEISIVTVPAYDATSVYARNQNQESDSDFQDYLSKVEKKNKALEIAKILALC